MRTTQRKSHTEEDILITLCDLNSNRLMAKAACRCKRPRKRRVKRRDLKKRKGGGYNERERSVPETL